ncbi:MAG TPA: PEP-CTERM sorting domain-containing protein [Candidatus Desulfobacillus sp.]|nr:PEP-CTERM sorting domain-containing protein [Candidatus Desulfobacillus sp.]
MTKMLQAAAFAAAIALAGAAHADTVIFFDNFNANAAGISPPGPGPSLVPTGWLVSGGGVDILGDGFLVNPLPGSGKYIDLGAEQMVPGYLHRDFSLEAGMTYVASFDLAGNQRYQSAGGAATQDAVRVNFGSTTGVYSLPKTTPWTSYSLSFTPETSGFYRLGFQHSDIQEYAIGMLLDNVVITAVPEPESWALMLAGLGLLVASGRRRLSRMS